MRSNEISRKYLLRTSAAVSVAFALCLTPDVSLAQKVKAKGRALDEQLELLNMWGQKPETTIQLYTSINNALAASLTATFKTVSEDAAVKNLCNEQGVLLFGGPLLGCIAEDSANVWVRTVRPASVEVRAEVNGKWQTFGPVRSTFESDLSAVVRVTGLSAGTTTPYKVAVDGKEVSIQANAVITTPPSDSNVQTRIVFGTCPHRWGLGNEKQADTILSRKPNAMLIYGDVAVQDKRNNLGLVRADYALRDFHPAWQNLVSAVPVYASWDELQVYRLDHQVP